MLPRFELDRDISYFDRDVLHIDIFSFDWDIFHIDCDIFHFDRDIFHVDREIFSAHRLWLTESATPPTHPPTNMIVKGYLSDFKVIAKLLIVANTTQLMFKLEREEENKLTKLGRCKRNTIELQGSQEEEDLATSWHHLHWYQIWLPGGGPCIDGNFGHQGAPLANTG